ncbi:MAG: nucleotidyl transferase AbiEii/AbiGii toxin family protein [Gemmatimonadaceae bacterium]
MPLTPLQHQLLADLSTPPNDARYLAGGAALHFAPNSARFSNDLDFFHDSEERVAQAFALDSALLRSHAYDVTTDISQPGFIRATVARGAESTRVDWAHDSAWRFMPLVRDTAGGLLLHPVDLAVNKVLALAGRDEPRDFVDILFVHRRVLPLGATVWAACGKDPGFTPLRLLELLKRRGRYHPEDFTRLELAEPFDLVAAKHAWLAALDQAEAFAQASPVEEMGCLYWNAAMQQFVMPKLGVARPSAITPHFGRPSGVLPQITTGDGFDTSAAQS